MTALAVVGIIMLVGLLGFGSGIFAAFVEDFARALEDTEQFPGSYSTAQLLTRISLLLGLVGAITSFTPSRAPTAMLFVSAVGVSFPMWLLTHDDISAWWLVPAGFFVLAGTISVFNPRSTSKPLNSRLELFALAVPVAFAVVLIVYVPILLTGRQQDIDRRAMTRELISEFCSPGAVCPYMHQVQKLSGEGNFLANLGSYGRADGQYSYPRAIAVGPSGQVYVAFGNYGIQVFDAGGQFIATWDIGAWPLGAPWNKPRGVASGPTGNVYVTGGHQVKVLSKNGELLDTWGTPGYGAGDGQFTDPSGIAVDDSGNVYVADTGRDRIMVFSSRGELLRKWGMSRYPFGIAVAGGKVYVTDALNHQVQVFEVNGTHLATWGSQGSGDGQFNNPAGIAVDPTGNVYVVDSGNLRVQIFEADGRFVCKWGIRGIDVGYLGEPKWLAIDASGDAYIVNEVEVSILILDPRPTPSELQPGCK